MEDSVKVRHVKRIVKVICYGRGDIRGSGGIKENVPRESQQQY